MHRIGSELGRLCNLFYLKGSVRFVDLCWCQCDSAGFFFFLSFLIEGDLVSSFDTN